VERRAYHAARPGFRITELQISPTQNVPWHSHSNVQDTFIEGELRVFVQPQARRDVFGAGRTIAPRDQCRKKTRRPSWSSRESANTISSRSSS
jgi:hypothetical protein